VRPTPGARPQRPTLDGKDLGHRRASGPAVYHYLASTHEIEVVRPGIDPRLFFNATVPVEWTMVAGAAVLVWLAGVSRATSESTALAATACWSPKRGTSRQASFSRRRRWKSPLDRREEQFLLGVLVGHAGDDRA
jgi:hypothetical protein